MAKYLSKMPKSESAATRDKTRDRDGWKANLRKARKAKGDRREFETGAKN
jgi:hypothetical protein